MKALIPIILAGALPAAAQIPTFSPLQELTSLTGQTELGYSGGGVGSGADLAHNFDGGNLRRSMRDPDRFGEALSFHHSIFHSPAFFHRDCHHKSALTERGALTKDRHLGSLLIFNHGDDCCQNRFHDITMTLLDKNDSILWHFIGCVGLSNNFSVISKKSEILIWKPLT